MSRIHSQAVALGLGAFVIAVAGLLAFPAGADEKGAGEGKSIKGWGRPIDPDGDCEIKPIDDGRGVEIKVPAAAHDYAAELKRWNAPRVVADVKGDFIAEVRVVGALNPGAGSTIEGRRPYHGAGLLLIKDKDTHVNLHHGCVVLDDGRRHYANFELRKDGEMVVSNYENALADAEDVFLRLERRGNRVHEATSPDGIHWISYDPIDVELPETVTLGIEAVNSSDAPLSVRFEDLAIFRKGKAE